VGGVRLIDRARLEKTHAKLRELVVRDVGDLSSVDAEVKACDAGFFCLGISFVGMQEPAHPSPDPSAALWDSTWVDAPVAGQRARRGPAGGFANRTERKARFLPAGLGVLLSRSPP